MPLLSFIRRLLQPSAPLSTSFSLQTRLMINHFSSKSGSGHFSNSNKPPFEFTGTRLNLNLYPDDDDDYHEYILKHNKWWQGQKGLWQRHGLRGPVAEQEIKPDETKYRAFVNLAISGNVAQVASLLETDPFYQAQLNSKIKIFPHLESKMYLLTAIATYLPHKNISDRLAQAYLQIAELLLKHGAKTRHACEDDYLIRDVYKSNNTRANKRNMIVLLFRYGAYPQGSPRETCWDPEFLRLYYLNHPYPIMRGAIFFNWLAQTRILSMSTNPAFVIAASISLEFAVITKRKDWEKTFRAMGATVTTKQLDESIFKELLINRWESVVPLVRRQHLQNLFGAIQYGAVIAFDQMLKQGLVNVNEELEGKTMLYQAVSHQQLLLAHALLTQYKADPNAGSGLEPLAKAYENGNKDMLILLLTHGAELRGKLLQRSLRSVVHGIDLPKLYILHSPNVKLDNFEVLAKDCLKSDSLKKAARLKDILDFVKTRQEEPTASRGYRK